MKDRWLSEIQAICREARAGVDGLSPEQANQAPQQGRWSVAQNLAHITTTARPYLERIRDGLAKPEPTEVPAGLLARFLVKSMEPPPRLRVKTMRMLEPPTEPLDVEAVLADFEDVHGGLADLIREADEDRFRRARFRSPFMSLIRLRLDQAVDTLLAHARRHIWQARQARRDIGVPD